MYFTEMGWSSTPDWMTGSLSLSLCNINGVELLNECNENRYYFLIIHLTYLFLNLFTMI